MDNFEQVAWDSAWVVGESLGADNLVQDTLVFHYLAVQLPKVDFFREFLGYTVLEELRGHGIAAGSVYHGCKSLRTLLIAKQIQFT